MGDNHALSYTLAISYRDPNAYQRSHEYPSQPIPLYGEAYKTFAVVLTAARKAALREGTSKRDDDMSPCVDSAV
jgi:hypothetical protein